MSKNKITAKYKKKIDKKQLSYCCNAPILYKQTCSKCGHDCYSHKSFSNLVNQVLGGVD